MQDQIDYNDPRSTAAAAILLARQLAPTLRDTLPRLLGQRSPGGLAVIAARMETDELFGTFVSRSLEDVVDQCEAGVRSGTTLRTEWVVARTFGGEDECEPVEVVHRTPDAEALDGIAARVRDLVSLIRRTEALLAADRIIAGLR